MNHIYLIYSNNIHFHCYAGDTQLHLSLKFHDAHKLVKLQERLKEIKTWMSSNFLLLNLDKTEVVVHTAGCVLLYCVSVSMNMDRCVMKIGDCTNSL